MPGAGPVKTGKPGASRPLARSTCTAPLAVATTTSSVRRPSRSAMVGDDSPELPRYTGNPAISPASWRRWKTRRSSPTSPVASVTRTRTVTS